MKYFSLSGQADKVSFREAAIRGLAPDKGLYFPESIPALPPDFFKTSIYQMSLSEAAFQAIRPFVGDDIPEAVLKQIVKETLSFDFPCKEIKPNLFSLELFHGPTMAFKDVGARFMARCLGYFNQTRQGERITVLVATSGDTGGAVANGFYGVEGVDVVILYPGGKVSAIQEKQLTALGKNITALEVRGNFDDCQSMVKAAFLDADFSALNLTSANSINVARWLPQLFYFLSAYRQLQGHAPAFVVPSGNFGNICAGILIHKMGMPVEHFIAATNINDTAPRYMQTGKYEPRPTQPTISNAMDVSDPSNFVRVLQLFGNEFTEIKKYVSAQSYTDDQTRETMSKIFQATGYVTDPHGAVACRTAEDYLSAHPQSKAVFLETAHPAKFLETVENTLSTKIAIPQGLQNLLDKEKRSIPINSYREFKDFLLEKSV